MDISVIIVSYNVRAFLEKCLVSVYRAVGKLSVEVIVVDNNSVDDSVQYTRSHFPDACVIQNPENLGFSKANNIGLERAKGEYILILNPDTVISEDTLSACINFIRKQKNAGIIGVKMLDGTGTYLPESKRGLPSPLSSFFKMSGINQLFPESQFFNGYYMGGLSNEETNSVPVLTGAFMFVKKSVIDIAGKFDEDYFMYGEDIDLCYRVLNAGFQNYYFPETSIIHYKGESTKRSSVQYIRLFYSAMLIFVVKHYKGPRGLVLRQILELGILLRGLLSWLRRLLTSAVIPAIDIAVIAGTLLAVKYMWAVWYFKDVDHFRPDFNMINMPLYGGLWLIGLALFGAYDRGRSSKRILAGILFGTVAILIVYALGSTSFRSSRAVIIIAAPCIIIILSIWHGIYERFTGRGMHRKVAVVGSASECERIMELLNRVDPDVEIVGAISIDSTLSGSVFIANIEKLETAVSEYGIKELIFSASDIEFNEISRWMSKFGSRLKYKIASRESDSIIGSDSKVSTGQLYTTEIKFAINSALNKRNKRLYDIFSSLIILLIAPFLVFFSDGRSTIHRAWNVFIGEYSWISYDSRDSKLGELPVIRPGYYSPAQQIRSGLQLDSEVHMINYLYAREYSIWRDVDVLLNMKSKRQRV